MRRLFLLWRKKVSEGVNEFGVPEQTAQTWPIKAECRGSNGACAPLDGTKKAGLWPACALQGQSADVARATAS
ncbi:MAG: hypothetical protein M9943_14495, partial [Burkholderiaceae bacterium]|nr:hypothetical protein [Burkholderiaceae bacterium]